MPQISRVQLVGIAGTQGIKDIVIDAGKVYVLGRADANDIVIKKNDISRQHANLEIRDDQFVVTDLGSANGTRVNGHRISGAVLVGDGDEVEFGDRKFRCQVEAPGRDVPPALGEQSAEATAMWAPSSLSVPAPTPKDEEPGDSPVDATQTFDPSTMLPPPPAAEPLGPARKAGGAAPVVSPSTAEIDVVAEAASRKGGGKGGLLVVAFVVVLLGTGTIVAWLYLTGRLSGSTTEPPRELMAWETYVPPPLAKTTEGAIKELSGPDIQLYDRALYFYEIGNFLAARRDLEVLAKRYTRNELINKQLSTVKEALSNEVERLLLRGKENMDFLKYREARQDFQGVMRLSDPDDKRRQVASEKLKELESLVGTRRR